MLMWCLQVPEEDVRSSGAGVTGGYELSYVATEPGSSARSVFLTTEPFLQP